MFQWKLAGRLDLYNSSSPLFPWLLQGHHYVEGLNEQPKLVFLDTVKMDQGDIILPPTMRF